MSWILNLKERAENLLDHIDDVAATALQKPTGNSSFSDNGRDTHHVNLSNGGVRVLADSDVLDHRSRVPVNVTDNVSHSAYLESKFRSRLSSISNGSSQFDAATEVIAFGSTDEQSDEALIAIDKTLDRLDDSASDLPLRSLEAKDHQIAILRLRVQELESAFAKSQALTQSADNELAEVREIENLRQQLHVLEAVLSEERKSFENAKLEYQSRIHEAEKESVAALEKVSLTSHELNEQKLYSQQTNEQLAALKSNLEACKQEFEDYKAKATRILQNGANKYATLQAKESTIMALKRDAGQLDLSTGAVSLEELCAERDILKEEVDQLAASVKKLKADVQSSESQRMADQRSSMLQLHQLEEQLQASRLNNSHYRLQLRELEQEAKDAAEEVNNLQRTLQVKLQEKDAEIKRLSREIIAAPSRTESGLETEQRLKQLMESLIKKQNTIETLQTDKRSLMLQLERVERMCREAESAAIRATYNSQGAQNTNCLRMPSFLNGRLGKGILKQADRFCYVVDTIM